MQYYCNICKKDISDKVYSYSKKEFGRPLCWEHQEVERRNQARVGEQRAVEIKPESDKSSSSDNHIDSTVPKSGLKSLGKVAAKMGKGVIKGVKKVVSSSKKQVQIRRWKGAILRRMNMKQLKQLCFENNISTKKTVTEEGEYIGDFYEREVNCSKADLVSGLKNRASLDAIISFANRGHISIRDIIIEKDRKEAEWERKKLVEKASKNGSGFLTELEKTIREFVPMRWYDKEIYYQDSLASFLKSKFPTTKIEVPRGTTRPDIVVRGVAIEIKGPTYDKDLLTIADKCLRYTRYFSNGMICVLFNVNVNEHRYNDWLEGMNEHHPNVKVIKISQ